MLHLEVLIVECIPINTRRTRSVAVDEVSALDHEVLDDTMEY